VEVSNDRNNVHCLLCTVTVTVSAADRANLCLVCEAIWCTLRHSWPLALTFEICWTGRSTASDWSRSCSRNKSLHEAIDLHSSQHSPCCCTC